METIDFLKHVEDLEYKLRNEAAKYENCEFSAIDKSEMWEADQNKTKAIGALKDLIFQLEMI